MRAKFSVHWKKPDYLALKKREIQYASKEQQSSALFYKHTVKHGHHITPYH